MVSNGYGVVWFHDPGASARAAGIIGTIRKTLATKTTAATTAKRRRETIPDEFLTAEAPGSGKSTSQQGDGPPIYH